MTTEEKQEHLLTKEEMANIEAAVIAKYGPRLKPGEWLSIDVKQDRTQCHAVIYLECQDDTERLELESVVLQSDNDDSKLDMASRFDHAIDFLDRQLERYFENDRFERFHDDWRRYDFESIVVRFRGAIRNPAVDQLADQWLASSGVEEE